MTAGKIFLRGLAFILPTILTLVILLWLGNTVYLYIIQPTNTFVKFTAAQILDYSVSPKGLAHVPDGPPLPYCGQNYRISQEALTRYRQQIQTIQRAEGREVTDENRLSVLDLDQVYVPVGQSAFAYDDYLLVARKFSASEMPRTRLGFNMEVVAEKHFPGLLPLSTIAILLIILLIYMLGRILTIRIGAWVVRKFESMLISRVPIVRNVYGSVKQVTDFLFSENEIEVRKVVAFEYPRKGIWSLGFVTGESMLDIAEAAGEPCVSVLVPSSPMPMTGYTMSVPKSKTIDLNITVDQAFQYVVSCGVLVPSQQRFTREKLEERLQKAVGDKTKKSDEAPSQEHFHAS